MTFVDSGPEGCVCVCEVGGGGGNAKNMTEEEGREEGDQLGFGALIQDVDLANDFLESKVTEIIDVMCPLKVVQYREDYKPWIQNETKHLMAARDEAMSKARTSQDPSDWSNDRLLRNRVNAAIERTENNTHETSMRIFMLTMM